MLKAGRVGISSEQVDDFGKLKDVVNDEKLSARLGDISLRENEGKPQYRIGEGEWENFNSGGSLQPVKIDDGVGGNYTFVVINKCFDVTTPPKLRVYLKVVDAPNDYTEYDMNMISEDRAIILLEYTRDIGTIGFLSDISLNTSKATGYANATWNSTRKKFMYSTTPFTDSYLTITITNLEKI